ncbi:MAG: hypothetical protein D8M59_07730 [Planctomycetes bacterium]|nr:hypothetical protein [Planctomycetota bacterium]
MEQALALRRFDIVQLLVEHGFDAAAIDMDLVFDTCDPQIMEFFIDHGADIHARHPFARALCNRVRTALGVYKRYRLRDESVQEQADIALRHHCFDGNMKWVSLLLWADADPLSEGPSGPAEPPYEDEDGCLSALELAALGGHFEVFELKPVRSRLNGPVAVKMLGDLNRGKGVEIMERLLAQGIDPNDPATGGCSAISRCIEAMTCIWLGRGSDIPRVNYSPNTNKVDTDTTRDMLKAIHLLAKHGGKWRPADKSEIQSARRSLLQLTPDYTVEFVWIMWKYGGCDRDSILELLRTPSIRSHTQEHRARLNELLGDWKE